MWHDPQGADRNGGIQIGALALFNGTSLQRVPVMECPDCHFVNSDQESFCTECGATMTLPCPRCKEKIPATDKFCKECGLKLDRARDKTQGQLAEKDGERKNVSVLFSDISGYTAMSDKLDPEEVREVSSRIFKEIAKIIGSYQGFLEKFIGDAVLAIFGLPAVHEDDPVRAVRAAMEIHRLVRSIRPELEYRIDQPLRMHSGIHTGLIVTGEMIVEKGVHGVVGDTLNLASRLADIAKPDEILISSQTRDLIAPYFETKPLGQVNLKGIVRPIKPHLILGALTVKTRFEAAKRHGFTHLIGRRRELALLNECLEKTVAGRGQFVTVTGEAGVGKSRLAYEFHHNIDRKKITVIEGRCQSYGSNIPYFPFLNALKSGLSLKEDDTHAQLEKKTISTVLAIDATLEQYLPLYLHLLSIPSKRYQLPQHLYGQKLKNSIDHALVAINLLNSKRRPMVLILEDWHWVDEASDSILYHLASQMEHYPLMLVVLCRQEQATHWPNCNFHTPCPLKAMDYRNTSHVIKSIWKIKAMPDGFSSFIHDRTGGNPFFIEEVCKALTEDGSVQIADQQIVLSKPLDQLKLPATVQAVIRARLDRLDNHAKETLQLAAVIGREFPLRLLERVSDSQHRLPLSLDVLKTQELIQQIRLIPDAEYMFKHVLTQVAAYESLLLKKRKNIHASVGLALEHLYAGRLEEKCEKLAHHYSNSTNTKKALFYLELAGTKAARVHSLSEARKYYETALSILDADPLDEDNQQTFINLTLKWADVSQYAPSNKIMNALRKSLEYARMFDSTTRIAEVSYWVGRFGYMQGDFVEAIPQVKRCIKWARELNDSGLLAISYNLFGRACLYTGDYAAGIRYLNKGLELIRPFEKWDDIAYSTAILGLLTGLTGKYKSGVNAITRAIKVARNHEIRTFEAMAFGYLGAMQFWYGNWNTSIHNCTACIDISQKLNNPLPVIWGTFFKGAALFNSGEQEAGLTGMGQSIDMITRMDSVLALRYLYSLFAENLAVYGNYQEAESTNNKAMALSQSGQKWGEIINYRTMGLLSATERDPDWHQVVTHMKKSIALSTRMGAVTELVAGLYRFADIMKMKGDTDRAKAYYLQGRNLADKIGYRPNRQPPEPIFYRGKNAN
jgi:class 3 adenylate cyclase/tetratricopeptide (TPR) repeat protein